MSPQAFANNDDTFSFGYGSFSSSITERTTNGATAQISLGLNDNFYVQAKVDNLNSSNDKTNRHIVNGGVIIPAGDNFNIRIIAGAAFEDIHSELIDYNRKATFTGIGLYFLIIDDAELYLTTSIHNWNKDNESNASTEAGLKIQWNSNWSTSVSSFVSGKDKGHQIKLNYHFGQSYSFWHNLKWAYYEPTETDW